MTRGYGGGNGSAAVRRGAGGGAGGGAVWTGREPVLLVLTEPDLNCEHGGVCVKRVEGPFEGERGAQRMAQLVAEGYWVHKLRPGSPGNPSAWS